MVEEEKISFFDLVDSFVKDKKRQVPVYKPRQKFMKETRLTNYSEEFLDEFFKTNELAYEMGSSRLGFCVDLKNDLTENRPFVFLPDLIWEDYAGKRKPIKFKIQEKTKIVGLDIIDDIIKKNPKMPKHEELIKNSKGEQEDLSETKNTENSVPVSETFAKILVKQKNIPAAIEIYNKLILKFPEKSSYFATLIENLKNNN